jgi:hypothetical protein
MGHCIVNRGSRSLLLASASALAMGIALVPSATAQSCGSGAGVTLYTACTGPFTWTGSNVTVTSAGTISGGSSGIRVNGSTSVGTLSNAGLVSGTTAGLYNLGTIASITNNGTITGYTGILNNVSIGSLTNWGAITGSNVGLQNNGVIDDFNNVAGGTIGRIYNGGTIRQLQNDGLINGGYFGNIGAVYNSGTISSTAGTAFGTGGTVGALMNFGLITGPTALSIGNTGSMSLRNYGTIAGNIVNQGTLTLAGGFDGTIGTLTGYDGSVGTITGSFEFLNGTLLLNDVIASPIIVTGTTGTLYNTGTIGGVEDGIVVQSEAWLALLSNAGTIKTSYPSYGAISNFGTISTIDNDGVISVEGYAIKNDNDAIITELTNSGTISGVVNTLIAQKGALGTLTNTGLISGTRVLRNEGVIGLIDNGGTLSSYLNGATVISNSGQISEIDNGGVITGGYVAISNDYYGTIGRLSNRGLISDRTAIITSGSIGQITNSGTIAGINAFSGGQAIAVTGNIDVIDNRSGGLISGSKDSYGGIGTGEGISISGTIGQITNAGVIEGVRGILLLTGGTIGTIENTGTIRGYNSAAILNSGSISTITNVGLIQNGIKNFDGTIDTLMNLEGATITGGITSSGTIATVFNEGLVTGDISTSQILTITSNGITYQDGVLLPGTLTGGTITGDVIFVDTAQVLDDDGYGAHVTNDYGYLRIGRAITLANNGDNSVLGRYSQAGGTLELLQNGSLTVGGSVSIAGGDILFEETATGNYFFGQTRTLVSGDEDSAYDGVTISTNVTGMVFTTTVANGDLVVDYGNYVGGTIASYEETHAVSGGAHGFYIAATGRIGRLTNSGTLSGKDGIINIGVIESLINAASGTITGTTINGLTNSGSIGALANAGTMGGRKTVVSNGGTIALISNSGAIGTTLTSTGIQNSNNIGEIDNSGTIFASSRGIFNSGAIGTILNQGLLKGGITAIGNTGTITALTNTGTIVRAIRNSGAIGVLDNSGLISANYSIIQSTGSIGTISNSGSIINDYGGTAITIYGGTVSLIDNAGTIGGAISITSASVGSIDNRGIIGGGSSGIGLTLASLGTLTNSGTISGFAAITGGNIATLVNSGAILGYGCALCSATIGTLTNSGTVMGDVALAGSPLISGGSNGTIGTFTGYNGNRGTFSGDLHFNDGALQLDDDLNGSVVVVGTGGTFVSSGSITGASSGVGVSVVSGASLAQLTNQGVIFGGQIVSNHGTIGTMTNSASATLVGGGIVNVGAIGSFANAGNVVTYQYGIDNLGTIDLLENTGTIAPHELATAAVALWNFGTIGTILNSGLIKGGGVSYPAIWNTAVIATLTNSGTITGQTNGIYNQGSIGTITNTGAITGREAIGNGGSIASIANGGTIAGVIHALSNEGRIENASNTGTILTTDTSGVAVANTGVITALTNSGVVQGFNGLWNWGSIGTLVNTGTIRGETSAAIGNSGGGVIGTLTNSGLITSPLFAIANVGSISIVNSGTIAGDILNNGTMTISGGSGGTVGTLTGYDGSIGAFSSMLTFDTGALLLDDVIAKGVNVVGTGGTLVNAGTIGTINGMFVDAGASLDVFTNEGLIGGLIAFSNAGSIGTLRNAKEATIDGGFIYAIYNNGSIDNFTNDGIVVSGNIGFDNEGSVATLSNGGMIGHDGTSTFYGVRNSGSIGAFANSGEIQGYGSVAAGVLNSGTISALTNSGSITGLSGAVAIGNTGAIGTIANNGQIGAESVGIASSGFIDVIINTGDVVSTSNAAIQTSWELGTLNNSGTLTGRTGVRNYGTIGLLANSGAISGLVYGVSNDRTLLAVSNSGTITSSGSYSEALSNTGSIGRFANDGLIEGSNGVWNWGQIDTLVNTGTIRGVNTTGLGNLPGGTIGTLSNSGLITGDMFAVTNAGAISIVNSGTIAGDIRNLSQLTISGGSNGAIGTLTGLNGGIGTFTGSALTFDTGALLLNDVIGEGVIVVGNGGTLINSGTIGTIAGLFISNGASLDTFANYGLIAVEGAFISDGNIGTWRNAASGVMDGATKSAVLFEGLVTTAVNDGLITGRYCGLGNSGSIGSFTNTGTIRGNATGTTFIAVYNFTDMGTLTNSGLMVGSGGTYGAAMANGGTIALLTNSGTIMGQSGAYAIANSGSIGAIANSGVISGAIYSDSALTFAGGTAAGRLTGGTIVAPSVTFASGTVILEDNIHGNAALTGSTLIVAAGEQIDGQYSQSDGTLDLRNTGVWTITGTAHISGGTVLAGDLSPTDNYIAGDTAVTLIDAASGSSYSGMTVRFGGIDELIAGADTSSTDDLRIVYLSDYVGGNLQTLGNTGSIGGGNYGVFVADTGSIGTFNNTGTVGGTQDAFSNNGTIGLLQNDGVISDGSGIDNSGLIMVLTNNGLIEGDSGIHNTGMIDALINLGTITGPNFAIDNSGSLGPISNTGLISGNIRSTSALAISGGTGAAYGVLSGGTITADVNFTSGNLRLSDAIVGQASNSGAVLQLASSVSITGSYSQTAGTLDLGTNPLTVSGTARFTGGTINAALSSTGNYLVGQSFKLIDASAGSSYAGAAVAFTPIAGLSATADTASTEDLAITFGNDYVGGSLASLNNTGTLSGAAYGVYVASTGTLEALSNSGTIGGTQYAIDSAGNLGTITNTGLISGNIRSTGPLAISGGAGSTYGVLSGGTITADVNFTSGNLQLADNIVGNASLTGARLEAASTLSITGDYSQTAGTLQLGTNTLVVSGKANVSGGSITAELSNTGNYLVGQGFTLIDASAGSSYAGATVSLTGITGLGVSTADGEDLTVSFQNDYVGGSLASLNNTGALSGAAYGVYVASTGTLGALSNSGTIRGTQYAIDSAGNLGAITNTGLISGNIRSTGPLAISGGTGSSFGVLSGGTITADVNFASGNLRLSDAIVGQASNSGAVLQLASSISITGSYSQTAGTLDLGTNPLTVSGTARFTGGTINAALSSTGNYLVGQSFKLIDASAGSSYAGAAVAFAPIAGLSATADTASTEDLAITFGNDYVGGSLASLNNTGTLSGAAYGVYVASTGTLGALSNSGTIGGTQYAIDSAGNLGTITNTGLISGNIRAAGQLVLAGTGGTLTGGTIAATGVSIAGSLRLADNINVGSGTVSAGTASVGLASKITITGNYLQTGGSLISDVTDTATYGALVVSGSATITNTTITVNGTSVRSGQTYTIVDAGAASSYAGDTINLVGAHYRAELSTLGDDLLASIKAMFGDIGRAKGGAAAAMGDVFDHLSDNTALQSTIDRMSLLSDADLGSALEQAAPAEVGGSVASLQRMSLIEDLIGSAVSRRHTSSPAPGWSVWQEVLGGAAQRSAVSGAAGYDTTAAGLVFGVDNRLRENLRIGAALSWSAGWNAGRGDVSDNANGMNSFALTGYGSWTDAALTMNGRVAIGQDRYNQRRVMSYLDDEAEAHYSGQHYVIAIDGSYDFDVAPNMTLSPQASLRWLRLATDGYGESGLDALTVGSVTTDQVQSSLGAKLAIALGTRFGLDFRAAWLHDFVNGSGETNAVLDGLNFTTTSARISPNGIRVGTGLTFYQSGSTSFRVEYDGEFRDDYTAHGGMLQLSLKL